MKKLLGSAVLISVFCTAILGGHEGPPNTLISFTADDFVGDRVIGRQLADLAEFSIHLLQWTETDRKVARLQKTLKGKVGAFFRPWTGSSDEAPSLEDIIRFTSKSYESLTCPQLIKLEVGTQVRLVPK